MERTEPVPAPSRPGEGSPVAEPHGGRRRRLTGAQRQRSILYAAAEVFARRGYDGARIEEIAEGAGVSKALIYEHFKGKRELYAHIRSKGSAESLTRSLEAAADAVDSKQRLESALSAFFDFVAEQPLVWQVVQQEVSDPELAAMMQNQQHRSERAIAALIAADETMAAQGLEPDQLELLAVMMNGAAVRAASWWLDNPSLDRGRVVGSVMQFMWLGLDQIRLGAKLAD